MGKDWKPTVEQKARYAKRKREQYAADPVKYREARRRWLARHPDYTYPGASKATVRSQRKRLSGMTADQYQRLLVEQNGVCVICNGTTAKGLAADHDHETGEQRGLLCARCNLGLGCFQDNQLLLHKAIMYLRKHERKVGLAAAA